MKIFIRLNPLYITVFFKSNMIFVLFLYFYGDDEFWPRYLEVSHCNNTSQEHSFSVTSQASG
jgi:hypothetical protein